MASAIIHNTPSIEQRTEAQEHFTDDYNLNDPETAVHDYARIIYMHTKAQMDAANMAARRRNNAPIPTLSGTTTKGSMDSVDSIDSRG